MNVPVCWRSKAQKGVTLSSSEAEYVAMSEAVKEIRFIYYLLRDIGIEVDLPILVKTDNVGAMFMAQNASSGVRTRHVDVTPHGYTSGLSVTPHGHTSGLSLHS